MNLEAFHLYMVDIVPTVVSVSAPDENDRSTWIVQCDPPATEEQQQAIDAGILAYDINTLPPRQARQQELAAEADVQELVELLRTATPDEIEEWIKGHGDP